MGFVVEPYSYFICYELKDLEKAKNLISDNFKLIKTKIFDNDEPKYYWIFACINSHTSAFWGIRIECYIIAEDKNTGLLSWIIIDYDTNTISYDKKDGLIGPNATNSVITTTYNGEIIIDVNRNDNSRRLSIESDIKNGKMNKLYQRLWLEGNLSIGYGKNISKNGDIFSLKFNPSEVEKALEIPLESLNVKTNSWFEGLFNKTPSKIVCFPYAQHFISDSPGYASNLKNKGELLSAINSIDFSNIKVFSTKSIRSMFLIGMIVSFTINTIFLMLLFLK